MAETPEIIELLNQFWSSQMGIEKPVVTHELESPFHAAGTSSSNKTGPNDSSNKMLRCTEGSLTSYISLRSAESLVEFFLSVRESILSQQLRSHRKRFKRLPLCRLLLCFVVQAK